MRSRPDYEEKRCARLCRSSGKPSRPTYSPEERNLALSMSLRMRIPSSAML
jgi:hypothetical protein